MTTFQRFPSSELAGLFGMWGKQVIFTQSNCIALLNPDDTIKYHNLVQYTKRSHYYYRQF